MSRTRTYCYKTIALLIAVAFVYVQAMELTCSISHMIDATGLAHHHTLGHDHHHDGAAPGKHHHDSGSHEENEKGCCSDFTQAFLSAFGKSHVAHTGFSLKQVETEFVLFHSTKSRNTFFLSGLNISVEPPLQPPKIPDIRVFICSFQV